MNKKQREIKIMELFTPAWNSKHPEKRMDAVRKITDLEKLRRIVEKMKYEDARQEAWKRLALEAKEREIQQEFWKRIALEAKEMEVRKAAIEKITDQCILKEIVLEDPDMYATYYQHVSEAALEKISDQAILAEIALRYQGTRWVNASAVRKIADIQILEQLAFKAPEMRTRLASFQKLPCSNESLMTNLRCLLDAGTYDSNKKRQQAANELLGMLKLNPKAAAAFWNEVRAEASIPHADSHGHGDYRPPRGSDCHMDRSNQHTDHGIGVNFPPFPFKD